MFEQRFTDVRPNSPRRRNRRASEPILERSTRRMSVSTRTMFVLQPGHGTNASQYTTPMAPAKTVNPITNVKRPQIFY